MKNAEIKLHEWYIDRICDCIVEWSDKEIEEEIWDYLKMTIDEYGLFTEHYEHPIPESTKFFIHRKLDGIKEE